MAARVPRGGCGAGLTGAPGATVHTETCRYCPLSPAVARCCSPGALPWRTGADRCQKAAIGGRFVAMTRRRCGCGAGRRPSAAGFRPRLDLVAAVVPAGGHRRPRGRSGAGAVVAARVPRLVMAAVAAPVAPVAAPAVVAAPVAPVVVASTWRSADGRLGDHPPPPTHPHLPPPPPSPRKPRAINRPEATIWTPSDGGSSARRRSRGRR